MLYTDNLNLKKPEQTEFYDVADFNANSDIIDLEIANIKRSYVTTVNGKKGAVTIPIATKEQAETGTDNTVYMSPLRTKEAIQKFAPLKTVNNQKPDSNGNVNVKEYTHPNSGVNAGVYRKVTVNAQGHVTAGVSGAVPIAEGGTGADNVTTALTNLGIIGALMGVSVSGRTLTFTKKDGGKVSVNTQDTSNGIVAQSLGQNGFVKFANGLILQWRFKIPRQSNETVSFPISNPNATLFILPQVDTSSGDTSNAVFRIASYTNSDVTFAILNQYNYFQFLVIGW